MTTLAPIALHENTTTALTGAALVSTARAYAASARSAATQTAYRHDWSSFDRWCSSQGLRSLPANPESVAVYLAHLADSGRKVAGIERALAAISQAHKVAGHDSPRKSAEVQGVMKGIRRTHGTAQRQKAPVLVDDLRRMVSSLPATLIGHRNRALLLFGFAGAFRRSELVALDIEDVEIGHDGITVTIRKSKTDQEGAGRKVGIPYGSDPHTCPVRALVKWTEASGIDAGPIFVGVTRHGKLTGKRLGGRDVARTVKATAKAAGLDASKFSGHSLRAGLCTSASKAGKSERAIMAQTGHRSVVMVRRYIRDANLFTDNAAAGIGL